MSLFIEFDNQPDPYYFAQFMASALYHAVLQTAPQHSEWIDSEGRYFLDVDGEIGDRHTLIRICNTLWQTLVHYPKPLLVKINAPPAESEEVKKNRRGFARAVQQANALELALEYAIQHDRQVSLVWTATSGPHRSER